MKRYWLFCYDTLKKISKDYQTPDQLRKNAQKQYGLDFEEALEMSYDNIQEQANFTTKGIRKIV